MYSIEIYEHAFDDSKVYRTVCYSYQFVTDYLIIVYDSVSTDVVYFSKNSFDRLYISEFDPDEESFE